jgi:agarase
MAATGDVSEPVAGVIRPGSRRGAAGCFQVGQDPAGRWWMLDPDGQPFFLRGVHGVTPAPLHPDGGLPDDPAARLRRWGFNAVGVGPDGSAREDGLPYLGVVEFNRVAPALVAPGLRLPDVFDPEWPRLAMAHAAAVCPPHAGDRQLIGWVTDSRLEWAHPPVPGRPALLQLCLSLEPGFAAYHAAWEFALALHGGKLDTLARAWGIAVPNKEVVRERTRAEQGITTRGYLRDEARWAREFARRYFPVTAAAVRAADPHHLVLGCRCGGRAGAAVLAECSYPAVDVALLEWRDLPAPGTRPLNPVLASDVAWTGEAAAPAVAAGRPRRLTTFERMLRRARTSLDRMARHPDVAGYFWSQWQDEPAEQPPFARGLVHVNGVEAREHVEVLAPFNLRAASLHRADGGP